MAQGRMARALSASLKTAPTLPRDTSAVALAKRYAALIDEAAPAAKYREPLRVLRRLVPADDPAAVAAFEKLVDALGEHSVASDLGPKLLAVLNALGMTAAGRSAKGGAPDGPRVPDQLAALRESADRRRTGGAR